MGIRSRENPTMQTVTDEPAMGSKLTTAPTPFVEPPPTTPGAMHQAPPTSLQQPPSPRRAFPILGAVKRWFDNTAEKYTDAETANPYAVEIALSRSAPRCVFRPIRAFRDSRFARPCQNSPYFGRDPE